MLFDPDRHHRRSIRLRGYDYTQPGAYFVTICTYQRQGMFSEPNAASPTLSRIGRIVAQCWRVLPYHFPAVELDLWVIMSDHLHGIVIIHDDGTFEAKPIPADQHPNGTRSGSLNAIIQNFKSISTRKANQIRKTSAAHLWQRDYYECIIRDDPHLHTVRRYIEANRDTWFVT